MVSSQSHEPLLSARRFARILGAMHQLEVADFHRPGRLRRYSDDAPGVSKQHQLEKRDGRIGRRAGRVIAELLVQPGQIKITIEQVI
jgi:hypothetical protein